MKSLRFLGPLVLILLTAVEPIWAQEEPELVLNPRLNALFGMSEIGLEGRRAAAGVSGGATIELGAGWNTLETGLLILRTGDGREASAGLPMYAKFRVMDFQKQSLFIKAGGLPVFQSNGYDVLLGAGLGGRIGLGPNLDLVLDATYNHGLTDASTTMKGTNQVEGMLVFTGLSFRI